MKLFFVILLSISTIFSAPLDSLLRGELTRLGYDTSTVGFIFQSPEGKTLASLNGDKKFILASVNKLYIGSVAFDRLGFNHTFSTNFYCDSLNKLTGEIIGNSTIKGFGDPGFTAEQLWLFAMHLKQQGIESITDTLFIDNSFFDTISIGPGFNDKMSSRAYMAPVSPLSVNFNCTEIHIIPTAPGVAAKVMLFPELQSPKITGKLVTVNGSRDGFKVQTSFNGSDNQFLASGTISSSVKPKIKYRKIWDPVKYFASSFKTVCSQVGIECDAVIIAGDLKDKQKLLYSFPSRNLSEQIKAMFKFSNNFIAEMLFKSVSAEVSGNRGSWSDGANLVKEWLKISIPKFGDINIVNGSGMSNKNLSTPSQISSLLHYAEGQHSWYPEFLSALPIAGVDGTLKHRFKSSILAGKLRAKTGTLNSYGVSNIAGYIPTEKGNYRFVMLINNRTKGLTQHWKTQELILTRLYEKME